MMHLTICILTAGTLTQILGRELLPSPYQAILGRPLKENDYLDLHGHIKSDVQWTDIKLLSGAPTPEEGRVHLVLNFRFNELKKLIINKQDEKRTWGVQEPHELPFNAGDEFKIKIRVASPEKFEISTSKGITIHFKTTAQELSMIRYIYVYNAELYDVARGKMEPVPYMKPLDPPFTFGRSVSVELRPSEPYVKDFYIALLATPTIPKFTMYSNLSEHTRTDVMTFGLEKKVISNVTLCNAEDGIEVFVNDVHQFTSNHTTDNPNDDYRFIRIEEPVELFRVINQ